MRGPTRTGPFTPHSLVWSGLAALLLVGWAGPAMAKRVCGLFGPTGLATLDLKPNCKTQKAGKLKISAVHGVYDNPANGCITPVVGTCVGTANGVRLSFITASQTCDDFLVEVVGSDLGQVLSARFERLQTSDHPTGAGGSTSWRPQDCKEAAVPARIGGGTPSP